MREKDRRLAEHCRTHSLDGVHLRRRSNIAWITGGADTHVDLSSRLGIAEVVWTVDPARRVVLTDNIEAPRLKAEEFGAEWSVASPNWWEATGSLPPELATLKLGTDWPDDSIAPLRWSLTEDEISRVRDLGRDTAKSMSESMRRIRPGWTEHRLAGEIIGALRALNIHTPVMLIASDDRLRQFRHPIPTDKPIARIVMAAICAQRHGLTVSITRLVSFGPVDVDLRRRHEAVCRVDSTLHDRTRPGARWCDIFDAARGAYAESGFADEWHKHHQGGPMGYELRDFKATPTETRVVVPRQLVGWNPSITGTKSEDTILTGPDASSAPEVITTMLGWPVCAGRPDILVQPA
jgi:Xaa-Pro aminopeptidase